MQLVGVESREGWVYFIASPDDPTERYLYRVRSSTAAARLSG